MMMLLGGCSGKKNPVAVLKPAEVLTGLTSFHYTYTSGYYANSGNDYHAKLNEDGTVEISIRLDGREEAKTFTEGPEFMARLTEIANEYEVSRWDGFDEIAEDVLDGDSFSFSLRTDSEQSVSCSGYMEWPDGYGAATDAFEVPFIELYEKHYPNCGKILQKYLEEELIAAHGLASEEEFVLPYLAALGPNGEQTYFERTVYKGTGGILGYFITDFGGSDPENENKNLLVYYFRKNEEVWQLSFELYQVQEDYTVRKVAEELVDSNVLMNDGIYSYLFRYYQEDGVYLGYSGCQKSIGGEGSRAYFLEAFKLKPDGAELIGEAMVEGADNREEWTAETIAELKALADEAGLAGSCSEWEERPWDPMINFMGKDVTIFTTSNFGSGFHAAREGLAEGEAIGDFAVKGKVNGCKYGYNR